MRWAIPTIFVCLASAVMASVAVAASPTSQPIPTPANGMGPANTLRGSGSNPPPPPTVDPTRLSGAQAGVDRTGNALRNASATPDARIAAAVQNASDNLLADINRQPLRADLTVGDLLAKVSGADDLKAVIDKADRVGGVRWIDADLCQVRLRVAGKAVQDVILRSAQNAGSQSPMLQTQLRAAMAGWERRSFSDLGTNAAAGQVMSADPSTQPVVALPTTPPAWTRQAIQASGHGGAADSKLRAARAAEQAALNELSKDVSNLPLADKKTVADLRSNPAFAAAIDQSLLRAKATDVSYHADGSADVQMSLDLSILWFQLQSIEADAPPTR